MATLIIQIIWILDKRWGGGEVDWTLEAQNMKQGLAVCQTMRILFPWSGGNFWFASRGGVSYKLNILQYTFSGFVVWALIPVERETLSIACNVTN
jgi:hypothetical protein